jgi:hypothetical protein
MRAEHGGKAWGARRRIRERARSRDIEHRDERADEAVMMSVELGLIQKKPRGCFGKMCCPTLFSDRRE